MKSKGAGCGSISTVISSIVLLRVSSIIIIINNVKPNFKSFDQYLTEPWKESFLISPCTKNEILEIISSLNYNKAVGINRIPIKILKLAKEQIADYPCFI